MPVGAVILLLIFPIADLALPSGFGQFVSHLVLLAAFTGTVIGLLRTAPARRDRKMAS